MMEVSPPSSHGSIDYLSSVEMQFPFFFQVNKTSHKCSRVSILFCGGKWLSVVNCSSLSQMGRCFSWFCMLQGEVKAEVGLASLKDLQLTNSYRVHCLPPPSHKLSFLLSTCSIEFKDSLGQHKMIFVRS